MSQAGIVNVEDNNPQIPTQFNGNTGFAVPLANQIDIIGDATTITVAASGNQLLITSLGGTGDVVGPATATDNAVSRFDGTTGKLIQNSVVIVSDTGNTYTPDSVYIGSAAPSNPFDISIEKSTAGLIGSSIQNSSANSSAGAVQEIIVEAATDDAYTEYVVNGVTTWSTGIDNSDADKYKITTGSSPSAGTAAVSIDTSANVSLSNALGVASGGTGRQTLTNHGVLVGAVTSAITQLVVATNGQTLLGSTGADPVFGTLTSSDGSISFTTGAGTLSLQGTAATPSQPGTITLATNAETIAGTNTTKATTPDDIKAKLGVQTSHGLAYGAGTTAAVSWLAEASNGQIPIGSTGNIPVLAALSAGSGITITNGAGSVTIASSGGGITWTTVTGTSQSAAVNSGYIANNAGLVTVTLPATSSVGDSVAVTGINNATGWKIGQNAGNQIFFGSASTTAGTGGSLSSTGTRDSIQLLCVTANATWNVVSSIGNITVV